LKNKRSHSRPDTCKEGYQRLYTKARRPRMVVSATAYFHFRHEIYMYVICSYRSEASCDEDHSPQETQARAPTETTGRYAFLSTRMAWLRGEDLVSELPNLRDLQFEAARCLRSQYSSEHSLKLYGKHECKLVSIIWTHTTWQRARRWPPSSHRNIYDLRRFHPFLNEMVATCSLEDGVIPVSSPVQETATSWNTHIPEGFKLFPNEWSKSNSFPTP
jgi:hypothetical protein